MKINREFARSLKSKAPGLEPGEAVHVHPHHQVLPLDTLSRAVLHGVIALRLTH